MDMIVSMLETPMTVKQPSEWKEIVSLLMGANSGGGTHGFEAYRGWLAEAW